MPSLAQMTEQGVKGVLKNVTFRARRIGEFQQMLQTALQFPFINRITAFAFRDTEIEMAEQQVQELRTRSRRADRVLLDDARELDPDQMLPPLFRLGALEFVPRLGRVGQTPAVQRHDAGRRPPGLIATIRQSFQSPAVPTLKKDTYHPSANDLIERDGFQCSLAVKNTEIGLCLVLPVLCDLVLIPRLKIAALVRIETWDQPLGDGVAAQRFAGIVEHGHREECQA